MLTHTHTHTHAHMLPQKQYRSISGHSFGANLNASKEDHHSESESVWFTPGMLQAYAVMQSPENKGMYACVAAYVYFHM